MRGQKSAMRKPDGNRRGADQHSGVAGEQKACDRAGRLSEPAKSAHQRRPVAEQDEFIADNRQEHAAGECHQNPRAHRHGGPQFEHAQHVEEARWAAKVGNQKHRANGRATQTDPQRKANQRWVRLKNMSDESDAGRDSGNAADKKIERHLPSPYRRLQRGQTVVTAVSLNLRVIRCARQSRVFRGGLRISRSRSSVAFRLSQESLMQREGGANHSHQNRRGNQGRGPGTPQVDGRDFGRGRKVVVFRLAEDNGERMNSADARFPRIVEPRIRVSPVL